MTMRKPMLIVLWGIYISVLATFRLADAANHPNVNSYVNKELGFRYIPPAGMRDETQVTRAKIHDQAVEKHTTKTLMVLLALTQGADPTSSSWESLTIQSYPRDALAESDDAAAKEKMSVWVVGLPLTSVRGWNYRLAGQDFSVTAFAAQESSHRRAVVVWTTIRKNQLLSFAFVSNSAEQLQKLTETMKTVQFF